MGVPNEVVYITLACLILLLLFGIGSVFYTLGTHPGSQPLRLFGLLCVGVIGAVWFIGVPTLLALTAARDLSMTGPSIIAALLLSSSILPAALLERHKPRRGVALIFVCATISTAIAYLSPVASRSGYFNATIFIVNFLLLPAWIACLLLYVSSLKWHPFRLSLRTMLLFLACCTWAIGTISVLVLKAERVRKALDAQETVEGGDGNTQLPIQ